VDVEPLDPIDAAWACRQRFAEVQREYYAARRRDAIWHRADDCRHTADREDCRRVRAILDVQAVLAPLASRMGLWLERFGLDPAPLHALTRAAVCGTSREIDDAIIDSDGALARLATELRLRRSQQDSLLIEQLSKLAAVAIRTPTDGPAASGTAATAPAATADANAARVQPPPEDDTRTLYLTPDGRGLRLGARELMYSKGRDWQRVTARSREGRLLIALCRQRGVLPYFPKEVASRLRSALQKATDGGVRIDHTEETLVLVPPLRLDGSLTALLDGRPGSRTPPA
jgi:hypothetical protein